MVNILLGVMGTGTNLVPVKRYEVWWMTPMGLFDSSHLSIAIDTLKDNDMDPALNVIPVCVAVDEDGKYETIGR